jgi:hypothetical protein
MGDNDIGYHHKHASDKSIVRSNVNVFGDPPAGLPTAGQKVPSPVFERSVRGAGKDLTRDHGADTLKWGGNLQPAGRR